MADYGRWQIFSFILIALFRNKPYYLSFAHKLNHPICHWVRNAV